jgi:hypothetical protein
MTRKAADPLKRVKEYEQANREAAAIIAADPARYGGIMREWAAMVIERQQPTITGPLFKGRAA